MITPGFFSFFNAQRGLISAQNALSTVNHNITNANTPGYTKQRIDLEAYTPYTMPALNGLTGGQIGQGPMVQAITRNRDNFLDAQFRQENGILGLNINTKDLLHQIEGILSEPSTGGISSTLQNFFDAAQEMSLHPDSLAVRSAYVQQAVDLVNVFQQQSAQLLDLRTSLVGDPALGTGLNTSQISITVDQINDKLEAITTLNQSIVSIQASGAAPNDLLDQRDLLLDELSKLVDISVTHYENGQIDVSIADQLMVQGSTLFDTLEVNLNAGPVPDPDDVPALISTVNGGEILNDGTDPDLSSGTLKAISDMGGNDPSTSTIRGVLGGLSALLDEVVTQVNALQQTGRDKSGNIPVDDIFVSNALLNPGQPLSIFHYEVNSTIIDDPNLVAAAIDDPTAATGFAGVGDGRNALALAQLKDQVLAALGSATFGDYFNGITANLGIDGNSYDARTVSQQNAVNAIDQRRQALGGVNVDEETIDMLRYQRAFEATSRVINTLNEMMKTIIDMV